MSRVTTAEASPNIAFIKYWGARDLERALPLNRSLSMTLSRCRSRCTLEPRGREGEDRVRLVSSGGEPRPAPEPFARPVREHLARMRRRAGREERFVVTAENDFPSAAGLASSASGFAALTLAAARALGLDADPAALSDLARLSGSGSAARSMFGGYVEWPAPAADRLGPDADGSGSAAGGFSPKAADGSAPAAPVAGAGHWDLRDVIAVVDAGPKPVSSREGHRRSATSPHMAERLRRLPERLREALEALEARDLARLGPILEEEAVDLHLIAMSSRPPIFYWRPGTLEVLAAVRDLRREGAAAWSTMDAGPNVHVICTPESEPTVAARLEALPSVGRVIRDRVGEGPTVRTGAAEGG